MEAIRLFVSLPFQKDGTAQDCPDCIRSFKAPELNRYLTALQREIPSAAEGLEDCLVTELQFGVGSFCHIPADDLEALYQLIRDSFPVSRTVSVRLLATGRGFDFYRLTAAKHLNEAVIEFLTPTLDEEELIRLGFGPAEQTLAALGVCFQAGYHRFSCTVSPLHNPTEPILRDTLSRLLTKRPGAFFFDAPLSGEQAALVRELLSGTYEERDGGWLLPGFQLPHGQMDQIGCGLGAITAVEGARVKASTDLDYYCEHSEDFEALVQPV